MRVETELMRDAELLGENTGENIGQDNMQTGGLIKDIGPKNLISMGAGLQARQTL